MLADGASTLNRFAGALTAAEFAADPQQADPNFVARDERRFQRLGAISRRARPLMPPSARNFGPHYLKWRSEAIARGDVASGRDRKPAGAGATAAA